MKTNLVKITLLCFCSLYPKFVQAIETKEEIAKVYSTAVVKRNNGNPAQVGIIEIIDKTINYIDVELQFPDKTEKYQFKNLEKSQHIVSFEFPILKERVSVKVKIIQNGAVLSENTVQFLPPKIWKIYDVQVSHHDLGYADYYQLMRRDVREMGIENAMEYSRKTDSWPKNSQFHWTIETSELLIQYLSEQSEEVLTELLERVKKGQIAIGGVHNSVSTEHLGYEAMARLFYTPNRYVSDWFNTKPSKTALITDVVGFSRSLAMYSKEADIPYFMFGRNSTVKSFDKAEDAAAFYWQSPDKDSKMTLSKVWHYYSPDRLIKYDVPEIAALCKRYEAHKNYPYSCILAEDSYDFGMPDFKNVEAIKKWNEEYANPVVVSGTFDMYFDDLNSQQDKESFQVFDEDVPNAWADEDLTDAEYAAKAKRLNSSLPTTEKWATIASASAPSKFPWIDIYQAYHGLLMWGEHTNGAHSEGPVFSPPSLDDQTAANITYYELEQEMHRDLVRESELFKDKALKATEALFTKQITTKSKNTLVVNNPLVRKRSNYVYFEIPKNKGVRKIIDNTTGKAVEFQIDENNLAFFYAEEVPSLGYKTFTLDLDNSKASANFKTETAPKFENDFYTIEFDAKSGGIKSLFDKRLKRELIDQNAKFKLNEYYYERFESTNYQEGSKKYQGESATFKVQRGVLADIIISEVEAEGSQDIVQKVTIYKNSNQIDFEVSFDKDSSGRTLDDYRNYSPKGKEGLFYSLPFNVPNFTIKHELAGGIMEPIEDQMKGSSTDYYSIQNFSDISNNDWGITLAVMDVDLVEYGKPRPAYWSKGDDYENIMKKAELSHFYLYVLNNMFFTNVRQSQPGPKNFKWSVRSHTGNWREGKAYNFGRDFANPLTSFISVGKKEGVLPSKSKSFIELDSESILCSTIKPAESNGEGYIMRFVEVSGQEQIVTVKAHFIEQIEKANFTNLVEVDRNYPLQLLGDNSFKFIIPAFGLRTIRVVPVKNQLPEIVNFKGSSLSDSKINLTWGLSSSKNNDISYYKVFRSETPNFKPSLRTFVDNTDKPSFIDQPVLNIRGWQNNKLEPETSYYYKVQAIGKNNRVDKVSSEIWVQTKKTEEVNEKPKKVLGLVSTLISEITNNNYIGLYFYTNVEKDINKYNVYRSTEKDFVPNTTNMLAEMDATKTFEHVTPHGFAEVTRQLKEYNRLLFVDEDIQPFTTYYYKVAAVDDAGQIGDFSREVNTTTGIANLILIGASGFRESREVSFENPNNNDWEIRYTKDGTLPTNNSTLYTGPFEINQDVTITGSLFKKGTDIGGGTVQRGFQKVKNYEVSYVTKYDEKWKSSGDVALIDNYRGDLTLGNNWQGFEVNDMDVTIDLKKETDVQSVAVSCLQNFGVWVFFPNYIEVFTSKDGTNFKPAGRLETIKEWQRLVSKQADLTVSFPKTNCRYVRVFAKNIGYIPEWHNFSGAKAWLFVDEIIIE